MRTDTIVLLVALTLGCGRGDVPRLDDAEGNLTAQEASGQVAMYEVVERVVRVGDAEHLLPVVAVDRAFFEAGLTHLLSGRAMEPADYEPAAAEAEYRVMVVTEVGWAALSDDEPLGVEVMVDGRLHFVVGVYANDNRLPEGSGLFVARPQAAEMVSGEVAAEGAGAAFDVGAEEATAVRSPSGWRAVRVSPDGLHLSVLESASGAGPEVMWTGPPDFRRPDQGLAWTLEGFRWITDDSLVFVGTRAVADARDSLPGSLTRQNSGAWSLRLGHLLLRGDGELVAVQSDGGTYPLSRRWGGTYYVNWLATGSVHVISSGECCVLVHEPTGRVLWVLEQPVPSPSGEWGIAYTSQYDQVNEISLVDVVRFTPDGPARELIGTLGTDTGLSHTVEPLGLVEGARWVDDRTVALDMTTVPEWLPDFELSEVEPFEATLRLDDEGVWHIHLADGTEVEISRR